MAATDVAVTVDVAAAAGAGDGFQVEEFGEEGFEGGERGADDSEVDLDGRPHPEGESVPCSGCISRGITTYLGQGHRWKKALMDDLHVVSQVCATQNQTQ